MNKKLVTMPALVLLVSAAQVGFSPTASAHNRGLIMLPSGDCVQIGSLKSVTLPDGTLLDLRPETPQDEIGTAFAANQGHSRIELGACP